MHKKRIQVNHIKVLLTGVFAASLMFAGCSNNSGSVLPNGDVPVTEPTKEITEVTPTVTEAPFVPVETKYEAEEGTLSGKTRVVELKGSQQYSGEAYVDGFENDGDSCEFNIFIEEEGAYDLIFRTTSKGGSKINQILLDGDAIGEIKTEKASPQDSVLTKVYLTKGAHSVKVVKSWGWILLDYLTVATSEPVSPDVYRVSKNLSNPNASDNTKRLYSFLVDQYGSKILSGQVCDDGMLGGEMQVIHNTTGEYPAILSMDLMSYTKSRPDGGKDGKTIDYGIKWSEAGGILEYHWHWTVKDKYCTGNWYSSFYTEYTKFNLKKAMNGSDKEGYQMLMEDIDAIAAQLKVLADKDIPILFRPLHEASGGWFWWGASGAESYKQLYILMYEKLTNEYGLNNLIWLWNGQDPEWYPGDEYVDILGIDIYPGEKVYTSQVSKFLEVSGWSNERKMVYLSECGCIFDPELAARDRAFWGCWCVWQGEFVKHKAFNKISEQYTESYMMKKAYSDERVINLGDIPDLKTYKMD